MDRRSQFEAITRALNLSDVSLPEDGLLRRGTLVAPSARGEKVAPSARGEKPATSGETSASSSGPASHQRSRRDHDAASLPRLEVATEGATSTAVVGPELELGELLGAGGMGEVRVARQRSLRREVAVKTLRAGPGATAGAGALLAEARITGALEHPSIVPVHALGVDGTGAPLLVMKRVEGATLDALVKSPEHPAWEELIRRHGDRLGAQCEVLMRVAEAVHFAHARGVLHRDIKPANIMVGSFGEVYLLDWGVALRRANAAEEPAEIVGTPQFMAPEMVHADPDRLDERTDVYLLGATLHAVLTGQARHHADSLPLLLWAAFDSAPVVYGDEIPSELAALCNAATAASIEARPATALAFRDALAAFLRHRGAMRLSAAAEARLEQIGTDPTPEQLATPEVAATLSECRFALTQSLSEWDGDVRAKAALQKALLWSVEGELFRRSPDGAATYARSLSPPAPELDARIEALRAELKESRRLEEAARREEAEQDASRTAAHRLPILLATLVLTFGFFVLAMLDEAGRAAPLPMWRVVRGDVVMLGIMSALLWFFRKRVLTNRISRQLAALFLLSLVASGFGDQVFAWRDQTSEEGGPLSIMLIGAVYLGAAIGMGGRLWIGAIGAFFFGVVGALWPATSTSMVGAGCLLCLGVLAYDAMSPPSKSKL